MNEASLGTFELDEATLAADEVPRPPPAPVARLPGAMLGYRCNEQGCCCAGWRIPFKPGDIVRLHKRLDDGGRRKLLTDVELAMDVDPGGSTRVREVRVTDGNGACRFLEPDGKRCEVHATHGLDALPDLCVDFPVATYDGVEGVDLVYDPVCPSVLDAIEAAPEVPEIIERRAPYSDAAFSLRTSHSRGSPYARLGAVTLRAADIDTIRRRVLASLADSGLSAWQHLHRIDAAYAALARGDATPDAFTISDPGDPGPYLRFLGQAIGANGVATLERSFEKYRRFVFAIPLDEPSADWSSLPLHLRDWGPAMERWMPADDGPLQPLLRRWLAHRHFAPFVNVRGELAFAAGAIAHTWATAQRYAAALGAVRQREIDVPTLKVALGAAEYLYRSLDIPPDSLPWFGIDP